MSGRGYALFVLLLISIALIVYSAAFSYRYMAGHVAVGGPGVWFEDPGTPSVVVQLYRNGTAANITINLDTNMNITNMTNMTINPEIVLARRFAIYSDTFDTNPLNTRLQPLTCNWQYNETGRRLYISINSTNSRGDTAWDFWCVTIVSPNHVNITSYVMNGSSVYVAFMAWRSVFNASSTINISAIYLNDTTTPTFYAIGYGNVLRTDRTGDYVYSNIFYYSYPNSYVIREVYLGVSNITEYEFLYHVSTGIDFGNWAAHHYVNATFSNLAPIPTEYRRAPYAVGIGYRVNTTNVNGTVYFDNLVVTVDNPPWYINVTGLPDGWRVALRNSTGNFVSNATASGGVAVLHAVPAAPVDIYGFATYPDYLIFRNATIEIYDANNTLVISRNFSYVIGGDLYSFGWSFNRTILSIYSNMSSGFYGMLANATAQVTPGVNASVGLRDRNGVVSTVNITVVNGTLISPETNVMYISPPAQWFNKWLAFNITSSFVIYGLSPPATYNIRFNFIWWVSDGVYAVYPVNVTVVIS